MSKVPRPDWAKSRDYLDLAVDILAGTAEWIFANGWVVWALFLMTLMIPLLWFSGIAMVERDAALEAVRILSITCGEQSQ